MSDINGVRISQPQASQAKQEPSKVTTSAPRNKKGLRATTVLLLSIILLLVAGLVFLWVNSKKENDSGVQPIVDASEYSAFFLTNGQVYFGKLVSKSMDEIVITDVYYVNVGSQNNNDPALELQQPSFELVKLGNEVHGPTDEMYINREHVVFYERLKNESTVVQSIINKQ